MSRLLVIPLALIALLAAAMAWSGGGVQKRADFAFINRGDIITLDLNQMSYLQDFRVTYGIREGLYTYDTVDLKPVPSGAVAFTLSDDKRVWTFRLRPEAKWNNGDPVVAGDYLFAWRRMLEEPGEYSYLVMGDATTDAERPQAPISDELQTPQVDWIAAMTSSVIDAGLSDEPATELIAPDIDGSELPTSTPTGGTP